MELILQPKDASTQLRLQGVGYYFIDYEVLHIWFTNGVKREYNMRHIWYVETATDRPSSITKFGKS